MCFRLGRHWLYRFVRAAISELALTLASALLLLLTGVAATAQTRLQYQSAFLRVEVAPDQPGLVALAVDSLGKNKLSVSPLRPPGKAERAYQLRREGNRFEYDAPGASVDAPPAWTFDFSPRQIHLRSRFSEGNPPLPITLDFDSRVNHATLLGLINADGSVRLPAILHLPDLGTFRIASTPATGQALGYDAYRNRGAHDEPLGNNDFVKVTFPAASPTTRQVDYTLDVVEVHPGPRDFARDPRFDGFRRNWLNIFQLNPRLRVLANHASSDPCAFTLFEYSSMAVRTPLLAPGVTALDLVRLTLDRYLGGMKGYGMAGVQHDVPYDFLDSYPSLLIAASDYVRGSKDHAWLEHNYAGLKSWASRMLAMDRDGQGLVEYPMSGNSGSWAPGVPVRPANWWDDIGFGHQDAYSNALAYHALIEMVDLARQANQPRDAQLYSSRAEKLRSVYFRTFFNPETGLIAGWKSADGKLHDYYFTFVNGAAIVYGLVPHGQANQIMDRLLAKLKQVGYNSFEYGLPGVLVPVRPEDYVWGTRDPFQVYQNGGATGSFEYFTVEALYQLGRRAEGDAILFPLLKGYEDGGFQGFGPGGKSYDWKSWDGRPHGYDGLLVDNYQALLAVLDR
jgi:hypothetical protein